jgi:hypothetical protein
MGPLKTKDKGKGRKQGPDQASRWERNPANKEPIDFPGEQPEIERRDQTPHEKTGGDCPRAGHLCSSHRQRV